MEHGDSEHIKEKSNIEMTIKVEMKEAVQSTTYIEIDININKFKEEPGLENCVKIEPALLVKEEIMDSTQASDEEHDVPATSTHAMVGITRVAADSVKWGQLLHIKEQLEDTDLDIGPTVDQHMNLHYRSNQVDLNDIEQENINNLDPKQFLPRIGEGQIACSQVRDETIDSNWNDDTALAQSDSITTVEGVVQSEILTCDVCNKTFKTRAAIRSHVTCVHGTSQFKCPECNKHFRCQQYLTHHIAFVHSPQHKCELCEKVFKCSKLLADHITFVHRIKITDSSSGLYACDYCLEKFQCKSELMTHLQNVHGSKSCRCKACKKKLRRQRFRLRHIYKGDGSEENKNQPYRCDECQKVYKSKDGLWHHSKRVHGTGSHKCTQCNKEFKCNLYLVRHVRYTHSEEQFECDICKKMCKSRAALSKHVACFHRRKYAEPKDGDYQCDKCIKTFQSQIALMRHYKFVHGTERYKCEECNKDYKCKAYLKKHFREVHSNKHYECDTCNRIFKSRQAVQGHILRIHSRTLTAVRAGRMAVQPCNANKISLSDSQFSLPKSRVYVQRTYSRSSCPKNTAIRSAMVTSTAVDTSAQQHGAVTVKSEPSHVELELYPVMFQDIDPTYRLCKEEPQDE